MSVSISVDKCLIIFHLWMRRKEWKGENASTKMYRFFSCRWLLEGGKRQENKKKKRKKKKWKGKMKKMFDVIINNCQSFVPSFLLLQGRISGSSN